MKDNYFKGLCIVAICIAVVGISIAYASLQQVLNISATGKVQSSEKSWKVHFVAGSSSAGVVTGHATAGTMTLQDTSVSISGVVLKAPGDAVTYTFKVQNDGEIPAKISTYTPPSIVLSPSNSSASPSANTEAIKSYVKCEITYGGSGVPTKDDKLAAGASKEVTVKISYDASANLLPNQDINVSTGTASITYVQD